MSKPIKNMIVGEYKQRFAGVEGAILIEIRGMPAKSNTALRAQLRASNVRVTVVKNTLAKRAFAGTPLAPLASGLKGSRAIVYGNTSVVTIARQLVKSAKENDQLALMGACLDGAWFEGSDGVKRLSKFPTREEAQSQLITLVLSPARKTVSAVKGPGGRLLGIVKEIQTRLEKGETISARSN
ncbi:MAG: 50S ribosomal protein L10 [Phycisphaerales bacterium]|nr:50S ribosomal protein L10 [Phycisphaerales bacterium]